MFNSPASQPILIEYGVYGIPIQLPESLEPQRAALQATLLAAQRRLRDFASRYGWTAHVEEPFAERFHVHDG